MASEVINIYKLAREKSCMTQEQASEILNIDIRTLQRYESGENIPNSLRVSKMIIAYDFELLGYLYLQDHNDVGKMILPKIVLDNFSSTAIRFKLEQTNVSKKEDKLFEIACDGRLENDELNDWELVKTGIKKLIGASFGLLFTQKEKVTADNSNFFKSF